MHRSGKSSISKVVFHKLSPNETLFLESTSKVVKDDISNSSFVQFQVPNKFMSSLTTVFEWSCKADPACYYHDADISIMLPYSGTSNNRPSEEQPTSKYNKLYTPDWLYLIIEVTHRDMHNHLTLDNRHMHSVDVENWLWTVQNTCLQEWTEIETAGNTVD